jgi:hypothetical protein
MTPSHDPSRTPSHGGAWDPTQPNTPARNDEFDYAFDASTPSPAVSSVKIEILSHNHETEYDYKG